MKNFIKNVKEHKVIALACLGVWLIIALAVMIVITVNNGGTQEPPTESGSSEEKVFFDDSDYPVTVIDQGNDMLIAIKSIKQDDQKWKVFVLPGKKFLTDNIAEQGNTIFLQLTPTGTGYNTICFVKETKVGNIVCDDVRIEIDFYSAENDDNDLELYFSDIRQTFSSSGALDSKTPFVLKRNRVLFPYGGDWVISPEEGTPEGLYSFTEDIDENGISYIEITKNISMLDNDINADSLPPSYKLVLSSESLGIKKLMSCYMGNENAWELSLAEDNDGEE